MERHDAFQSSRLVLEEKARIDRKRAEDNIFWESGQLGSNSSRSLIQTVWWDNCLKFGMRRREENHSLKTEHFCLKIDENGRRYT